MTNYQTESKYYGALTSEDNRKGMFKETKNNVKIKLQNILKNQSRSKPFHSQYPARLAWEKASLIQSQHGLNSSGQILDYRHLEKQNNEIRHQCLLQNVQIAHCFSWPYNIRLPSPSQVSIYIKTRHNRQLYSLDNMSTLQNKYW